MIPKHTEPRYKIGQIVIDQHWHRPCVIVGLRRSTCLVEDVEYEDKGWEYNLYKWHADKHAETGISLDEWGWDYEHEIAKVHKQYPEYIPDTIPIDAAGWDKLDMRHREWLIGMVLLQTLDLFRFGEKLQVPFKLAELKFADLPEMLQTLLERLFRSVPIDAAPVESRKTLYTMPAAKMTFDRDDKTSLAGYEIKVKVLFDSEYTGVKRGDVVTLTHRLGRDDSNHRLYYKTDEGCYGHARNWQFEEFKDAPVAVA